MSELRSRIAEEIAAAGSMPFSRFVERSLYEPELGFYESSGQAGGRRGDFVTSVETGPLFAVVLGAWLDVAWDQAGRPDRFVVAEAAAGVGTLWRGIVRARPSCFDALDWILVERSHALRSSHGELPGSVRSLAQLPEEPVHVVVANELLDNLVFDLAIRTEVGWHAQHVVSNGAGFALEVSDVVLDGLPDAPVGTSLPVPVGATAWLAQARAIADRVLLFDYTAADAVLVERGIEGWLRCYSGHQRVLDPLTEPGRCDITHDVPIDRLPSATTTSSQADWLRAQGIEERVEQAKATWRERGHIGDLEAMFARSAVGEAEALLEPGGLGGFTVIEYRR